MPIMLKKAFYFFPLYFSLQHFIFLIIKSCRVNQENLPSTSRSDCWKAILCECFHVTMWSKLSEERPLTNLVKRWLNSKHVLEDRDSILLQRNLETYSSCRYLLTSQSKRLFLCRGEDGPMCQSKLWVLYFCESVLQSLYMCKILICFSNNWPVISIPFI